MTWLEILIIDVVVIGAIALSYVGTIRNIDRKLGTSSPINQKLDTSSRQINQNLDIVVTRMDELIENIRELRIQMRLGFDSLEKQLKEKEE